MAYLEEKRHMDATISLSNSLNSSKKPSVLSASERIAGLGAPLQRDQNTEPGVLVLNQDRRILYLNRVAKKFLKNSTGKQERGKSAKELSIHEIIFDLVLEFKRRGGEKGNAGAPQTALNNRAFLHQKKLYQVGLIPLASDPLAGRDLYHLILIEKVMGNFQIDPSSQATRFTAREKMLVTLLSEGKTNKDLAHSMGISEYTVKEHIRRIMRKLNVTTRSGIVAKLLTADGRP